MVSDNHSECKNAILGLMDALSKIKNFAERPKTDNTHLKAILTIAQDALDRHKPILPRLEQL